MTTGQKIIKYCAMTFALFLILNILNGICSAVFCVAGLTGKNNSEYMKKGAKEYVIEEDVTELKIDLSVAELEIKTGDELKVETNHRYIQCRVDDGCLVIQEKRPFLGMNAKGMNVCLTIPESMVWESIDMDAGIGDVTIEDVSLNNADIDIGIGELDLTGGVLRVDGEVVAFTMGEPICSDTFVVHIEKAFANVDGAYAMINQQFVEHECMNYTYVNSEEDTGAEGLRKAKLSYRPVFLVEKGIVTEKGEEK